MTTDAGIEQRAINESRSSGSPMTGHPAPERADQRQKRSNDRDEPALQPARCANANQLAHEQAEIEAGRVNRQPRSDVRMPTKKHAAHAAGLTQVRAADLERAPTSTLVSHAVVVYPSPSAIL